MSRYYLVAHNKETDDYRILPIMSKWYWKNGDSVLKKENALEAIDLVTSRFASSSEMAKRLCMNHYLPNENYDFLIVQRYRKNQSDAIRMHEVFYNVKPERTEYFRTIAAESIRKDLKNSKKNLRLFDRFLNKLYYNPEYYRIVQEGLSEIPKRVSSIYEDCNKRNTPPYFLKYHNTWIMENYAISRSIVESFNRFDQLDTYDKQVKFFQALSETRCSMTEPLMEITSPEYLNGQMSLDLSIPKEDKMAYTLKTLLHLNIGIFEKKNNRYSLNEEFLNGIGKDAKKIRISSSVLKNTYWYLFHKMKLKEFGNTYGNMLVLQEDMDADYRDLKKSLSKENVLDSAYRFCLLYNNSKNKQKVDDAYQKRRGTK